MNRVISWIGNGDTEKQSDFTVVTKEDGAHFQYIWSVPSCLTTLHLTS